MENDTITLNNINISLDVLFHVAPGLNLGESSGFELSHLWVMQRGAEL